MCEHGFFHNMTDDWDSWHHFDDNMETKSHANQRISFKVLAKMSKCDTRGNWAIVAFSFRRKDNYRKIISHKQICIKASCLADLSRWSEMFTCHQLPTCITMRLSLDDAFRPPHSFIKCCVMPLISCRTTYILLYFFVSFFSVTAFVCCLFIRIALAYLRKNYDGSSNALLFMLNR